MKFETWKSFLTEYNLLCWLVLQLVLVGTGTEKLLCETFVYTHHRIFLEVKSRNLSNYVMNAKSDVNIEDDDAKEFESLKAPAPAINLTLETLELTGVLRCLADKKT